MNAMRLGKSAGLDALRLAENELPPSGGGGFAGDGTPPCHLKSSQHFGKICVNIPKA